MAQFLFYDNLTPLNRERHKQMRLKPAKATFGYAKDVNSVPIAAVEFGEAAHEYPIVFAGSDKDSLAPAVLLGLADGANFYVDDDGNWSEGYKPAFVRMYPFVLANKGEDEFAVCVDEGFEGLNEDDGERLFDDEGKESEGLQNAIKFLTQYQGEMRRTGNIMKTLSELDLLAERTVQIKKPDGTQTNLKGIYAIDEAKLNALDDEKVVELFRNGTMACIFAHLLSLRNLARLTRKLDKGQAAESSEGQTIN